MPTIFSRIAAGEIPCARVAEDGEFLAFLDIAPVAPGHTLVVTKREVPGVFDLPPDEYARLMEFCRRVAAGLRTATGCQRVCLGVFGFDVPHAHVHLVPLDRGAQFPFPPQHKAAPEELQQMAAKVRAALKAP